MPPPKFSPHSFWLVETKFLFSGRLESKQLPHQVKKALHADPGMAVEESSFPERWKKLPPTTIYPLHSDVTGMLMMGSRLKE